MRKRILMLGLWAMLVAALVLVLHDAQPPRPQAPLPQQSLLNIFQFSHYSIGTSRYLVADRAALGRRIAV